MFYIFNPSFHISCNCVFSVLQRILAVLSSGCAQFTPFQFFLAFFLIFKFAPSAHMATGTIFTFTFYNFLGKLELYLLAFYPVSGLDLIIHSDLKIPVVFVLSPKNILICMIKHEKNAVTCKVPSGQHFPPIQVCYFFLLV